MSEMAGTGEENQGGYFKQSMGVFSEAFKEMPSVGEAFGSAGRGIGNWVGGLGDGIAGFVKKTRHIYDDNVVIPEGEKTLLGEDMSTLFASTSTRTFGESSGSDAKEIVNEGWYGTEMMSANLKSGSPRSVATLTAEQRAAFEIVLLSKKYADMYEDGKDDANERSGKEYADLMARYKATCEANGTNWDEAMNYACWEMQSQSAQYRDDSKGIYAPEASEKNRVLVNRAHGMLVGCGNEGWEETMLPHVASRISKEDTFDTEEKYQSWVAHVVEWVKEKWTAIKGAIGSPWAAVKSMVPGAMDAMDTYATYNIIVSEEHKAEYEAAKDKFIDTIHGKVEDVKEKVPAVGDAIDAVTDKYEQAKDSLGVGGEEPEAPEEEQPEMGQ